MAASLSDILSAAKQLVIAVNSAASTYLGVQGAQTRSGLTAATLLKSGAGRICQISVTTAGSATGEVYDAAAVGSGNPIYTIPAAAGLYLVNMPTSLGIVVVPGPGQTLAASFS